MTVDQAFDRIELIKAHELQEGDVVMVAGGAPMEISEIHREGEMIQLKCADHTEKFVWHETTVSLCMD